MFEKEIAAGIKWATEKDPEAFAKVDPDGLDMGHGVACVLGQMFEKNAYYVTGYDWACDKWADELDADGEMDGAIARGFKAARCNDYPLLTAEWQEALRARGVPA